MLTYEALIAAAKSRSMPAGKIRGILREYLQILIMKELCMHEAGKRLYFTGGTYLRLVHNLKRFSEDLDFNAYRMATGEFESLVRDIGRGLERSGVISSVKFSHWKEILEGKLFFRDIEKAYNVASGYSKGSGIVIKIEANNLNRKVTVETEMITGFGEFFPCPCTGKGFLFADKIDALIKKERGRHIYDIIFMLSNRYPIDKTRLKTLGIKGDPLDAVSARISEFSVSELNKQAETLRPFLFDEGEANLVIGAPDIIASLVNKYRMETSQ